MVLCHYAKHANHSAEGSNAADGGLAADSGGPLVDPVFSEGGNFERTPETPNPDVQLPRQRADTRVPGRRQPIKWPKANEAAVWQQLDKDLSFLLQHSLRGQVETKLNSFGEILYEECRDRFGAVVGKQSSGPKQKGRREREIELLVRRRRHLRKQWRKASEEEREGLKPLWEEVRKSLGSLRRAERIRKRRMRKEKERSSFCWKRRGAESWRLHNLNWSTTSRSSTATQRDKLL